MNPRPIVQALSALLACTAALSAQGPTPRPLTALDSYDDSFAPNATVSIASNGDSISVGWDFRVTFPVDDDEKLWISSSNDAGLTWGPTILVPTPLPSGTPLDLEMRRSSVQRSGQRVYFFWGQHDDVLNAEDIGFFLTRSFDGGLTWEQTPIVLPQIDLESTRVSDKKYRIVPGEEDDTLYALHRTFNSFFFGSNDLVLLYSQDSGSTWGLTEIISYPSPGDLQATDICVDSDGAIHVVYAEEFSVDTQGTNIWYIKSTDGGLTFSPRIQVDSIDAGLIASGPDNLSVSAEGARVGIAWIESVSPGTFLFHAASNDGGQTFAPEQAIPALGSGDTIKSNVASEVVDGNFVVTYHSLDSTVSIVDLMSSVSVDGGFEFTNTNLTDALDLSLDSVATRDGSRLAVVGEEIDATIPAYERQTYATISTDAGLSWSPLVTLVASDSGLRVLRGGYEAAFQADADNLIVVTGTQTETAEANLFATGFSFGTPGSFAVRNAGTNPLSFSTDAPPLLGQAWEATLDLALTGQDLGVVIGTFSALELALPGGQTLLTNLADPGGELFGFALTAGPTVTLSSLVPNDPALVGVFVAAQGAQFGAGQPFQLSNALDLTIGTESGE